MGQLLLVVVIICLVLLVAARYFWIKGPNNNPSRLLQEKPVAPKSFYIVSSHWNEDVNWLTSMGVPYSICDKAGNPKYAGTGDCDVPANKGRECSAYLQWIVSHYDNLPDRIAFIHGHEAAWHQQEKSLKDVLLLARDRLEGETKYTSLNDMTLCLWRNCPRRYNLMCDTAKRSRVLPFWDELIAPHLNDEWPTQTCCTAWNDCCAQFIVTKELILRHPKSTYERMLHSLLQQPNDVEMCFAFETVWHAIFGEKLCADWDRDCPIDHTIGARLQGQDGAPACLTNKRP